MQLAYDLHIHTAASPCGHQFMTPNNIVNMSLLKGLDVIAITDHQTVVNCEAVMKVGLEKGLYVIPGIEVESREEIHWIVLFRNMQSAKEMEKWLATYLPPLKNRRDIFGVQSVVDEADEVIGEIEQMLLVAAQVSAEEMLLQARQLGGVVYPAHIDRSCYSILSNLGSIPLEYALNCVEISKNAEMKKWEKDYNKFTIIRSSDAHYLEDIAERKNMLAQEVFEKIGIYIE